MTDLNEIKKGFENILKDVKKNPGMNEPTLRINFAQVKILKTFGYSKNEIFFEERVISGKRTDIHCTDEFGDVIFVIEFKKPSVENLGDFEDDLWTKYVKPLKAKYGMLYNGKELFFYERKMNRLIKNNKISRAVENFNDEFISELFKLLTKPDYGTTLIKNVKNYLDKFTDPDERLALEEEISREHFYESFKLREGSIFSSLVCTIVDLFKYEKEKSTFTKSAYNFWKRSYAKSLTKDQVPKNWIQIFKETGLSISNEEDRYIMTFCLETAFALFMRLILTKACEDYSFPDARFSDFLENEIKKASRSNKDIAQSAYPKIAMEIIRDMQEKLITSVFEEDIFYWWTEEFDKRSYQEFFRDTTLQMTRFGRNVAKILLAVYKFNFSRVEGDPLGILYQKYFDTETRKALGEFYTPIEVVEYILNSVGYNGSEVINKRLLDPACGSGTFLVGALKRYLCAAERKAQQEGWSKVLDDLCNKYHIVGFDIHPFATIMSQVQFTLALLPHYKLAKDESPEFVLNRLPIFRTDSLTKEKQVGRMKIEEWDKGKVFSMKIELPVQKEDGATFFEDKFSIPDEKTVFDHTDISTIQQYFGALQAIFDTVKQTAEKGKYEIDKNLMQKNLQKYLVDMKWNVLVDFFEEHSNLLLKHIKTLKTEFDDGRLIKSIEDVMLAALLKNFVDYDFVVGNPPYVRIQDLPEKQKENWSDNYNWTDGNYDIFIPFIERGLDWIKDENRGKLSYIVSNRFLLTNYGRKMREGLPEKASIEKLLDLKDSRVFEDALNYPAIFVFSKGKKKKDYFPVARVFKDPNDGKELLSEIEKNFGKLNSLKDHEIGKYSDAFYFEYKNLRSQGWYLMPQKEWKVFIHIENEMTNLLESYTKTKSCGFEGISTSNDNIYVLKLIEERKDTIVAKPKGGGEPVEIEKDLVRPFLFGKDVHRWKIDWKGWYVLFPYKKYVIDNEEKYKLIPSKEYKNKFDYGKGFIEDLYKIGWNYFQDNEQGLRNRENGIYTKGKSNDYKWFGITYPRNIEKYDEKKLLIQTLADSSNFVYDENERYVFAGAGGSNVFGILLKDNINPWFLLSILNSQLLEYYHKHISNIFSGKFYSYGDQFIKLLPIKEPETKKEKEISKNLASLAKKLLSIEDLKRKIKMFPTPYFSQLRKDNEMEEFFEIRHIVKRNYSNVTAEIQEDLEGNKKIKLGKNDYIDDYKLDSDKKIEYIIRYLKNAILSKDQEIILRIPTEDKKIEKIVEMHNKDLEKLGKSPKIEDLEDELNTLVYKLYKIEDEEVIKEFLDTF